MDLIHNRRYRLTRDVPNPELDRRQRYDIGHIPWTKGMTFRVTVTKETVSIKPYVKTEFVTLQLASGSSHIWPSHAGYADLVAALEPVPENALDVLSEVNGSNVRNTTIPTEVLVHLYESGVVTREQLAAATQAVLDKYLTDDE